MTDLARGIERLQAEWIEEAQAYEYEESPGVRYRVGARSMQRLGAALAARGPDDVDPYSEWCTHADAERV